MKKLIIEEILEGKYPDGGVLGEELFGRMNLEEKLLSAKACLQDGGIENQVVTLKNLDQLAKKGIYFVIDTGLENIKNRYPTNQESMKLFEWDNNRVNLKDFMQQTNDFL